MRASLIMPNFLRVVDTILLLLLLLFAVITILNITLLSVQVLICGRGSIQLNLNRLINRTTYQCGSSRGTKSSVENPVIK